MEKQIKKRSGLKNIDLKRKRIKFDKKKKKQNIKDEIENNKLRKW